jgi:transposase
MVNSKLAKFGRSKEKRSDAKIIVLALVVNTEGFLKYSNVFEGNTSDSQTLPDMVEKLRIKTSASASRAVVVMDAGIATDENLQILEKRGYYHLCVNRSKVKDYKVEPGAKEHRVLTNNKEVLSLIAVKNSTNTDYYVRVKSPGKRAKETAMKQQFESRFEDELKKIQNAILKKHGSKKLEVINRRIGRASEKYPLSK